MAAKKRRKKTGKSKTTRKKTGKRRSGKKRARSSSGKKTTRKKRRKAKGTKKITIVPLGTLGDIRTKAKRTGQSIGDVILEAMKKGAPRGKAKKPDLSRIVTAQLLLPR